LVLEIGGGVITFFTPYIEQQHVLDLQQVSNRVLHPANQPKHCRLNLTSES
jgi:hypothetical protein